MGEDLRFNPLPAHGNPLPLSHPLPKESHPLPKETTQESVAKVAKQVASPPNPEVERRSICVPMTPRGKQESSKPPAPLADTPSTAPASTLASASVPDVLTPEENHWASQVITTMETFRDHPTLILHPGRVQAFITLLEKGPANLIQDGDGNLLHLVAKWGGPLKLVKILIDHGVSLDKVEDNMWGNTPLLWAIANGNNNMAMEILNYEQNLNLGKKNTALHLAIAKGYTTHYRARCSLDHFQLTACAKNYFKRSRLFQKE